MRNLILVVYVLFTHTTFAQEIKTIQTDIFKVTYSEIYQQPLEVSYKVECSVSKFSRKGMDFKKYDGVITSDNGDYKDNASDPSTSSKNESSSNFFGICTKREVSKYENVPVSQYA